MFEQPKNVVFRCDASHSIGTGHLMRSQTLAAQFKAKGYRCIFLVSNDTLQDFTHIFDEQFEYRNANDIAPESALTVIDHYSLDHVYEASCRAWASKILVIDDLADRQHECDFLLDQTEGRSELDYQSLVPQHCHILTGAKFALLRGSFKELRVKAKSKRADNAGAVKKVLVSLGGTNLHKISERVIVALQSFDLAPLEIDLVIGNDQAVTDDLRKLIDDTNLRTQHEVILHSHVSGIEALMLKADIAIGAGGTSTWERCCLGLPSIMIELADNQSLISKTLHRSGAAINLGWHDEMGQDDICLCLESLYSSPQKMIEMQDKALEICDGNGARRVVEIITESM